MKQPGESLSSRDRRSVQDQSHQADWTLGPARRIVAALLLVVSLATLTWTLVDRAATDSKAIETQVESELLDVNTASADQLRLLPGVGPAIAARIVAERTRGGSFRDLDDLSRVKGVGPRTIASLKTFAIATAPDQAKNK